MLIDKSAEEASNEEYGFVSATQTGGIELPNVETITKQVPSYQALNLKLTLGSNVFESCTKLKSVIINSAVSVIGNSAFKNCSALSSIIVRSLILKTVGKKALVGCTYSKI